MPAARSAPSFPLGVARARRAPPTVAALVATGLRVVDGGHFVPRGGRYDVRPLRRSPVRALRGGAHAMVAAFQVRDGGVEITLLARDPSCAESDRAWAMESARAMIAVDDDPSEFLTVVSRHPLVGVLARRFDCRLVRTPTVFEAFTRTVIEQLVTTFEASASIRRLTWIAGALVPGTTLRAAPTAEAVLAVPPWKLHAIGIGSRRSRTLREGARRAAALERLRDVDAALAATKLESLPGVGPWTANLVARAALGWADAVPVGDVHAHYVITEVLTGVQGDDDAMLEALAPFRPHRARVVELIMQAQIADALPGFERMRRPLPRIDPHRREPWRY
jgi:3-methyladenine DNA glycosylase/8-oxoguanine DNA glycosylase